jgi:hypothetical protein
MFMFPTSTAVLAEKPSVARDIARVLGATSQGEGYLHGNGYIVTWAIGHLGALAQPHEIEPQWRRWHRETLPMLPKNWPLVIYDKTKDQFETVRKILNSPRVAQIVCATDAGREGELIFRYIYEAAQCDKPFSRLWISSLTPDAIRKGFDSLRPGRDYDARYEVDGQSRLQVNETEAAQVREIFARLVGTGSVEETLAEIARRGWRRKRWRTREGKEKGGRAFDRGSLVRLLSNVVYRGQVQHHGKVYRGEQAAIVEPEIWKQAQEKLRRQEKRSRRRVTAVRKEKEPQAAQSAGEQPEAVPQGRVPRISGLMALAVRMEWLVRDGKVKDYAELARLGGVSRARVTQVLNLRNLAPAIQERLLFREGEREGIHERALRRLTQSTDWEEQLRQFGALMRTPQSG